ncbi:alpha/beta hydrolase [Shimwellia pseudoproteus]|uniref:alpha/beta hydrolase n=1 Tax=Shimwellia pseudoproteus TaxID=570012 RepID=UPI0018ECDA53|nr:alpha/beta hydrolase-fold protein [Shimwellia pseudoproteus]MBJ3814572.1 alpha/beta hydrolase [Shimwellia pseudoproteus]
MRYLICLLMLCLVPAIFSIAPASARPDMTPLGKNIADTGSAWYHFTTRQFSSADGKRHYQVWIGTPRKAVPGGYPVLYLLDGNAVMSHLDDPLLGRLSQGTPPVIVAVGYRGNLPFDRKGRSYDYTPPGSIDTPGEQRDRVYGGSREFLALLRDSIIPGAEQGIVVNPARRGIWGHSYGGLLVLDAWLHSKCFTRYYSASPSFWQGNFRQVDQLRQQPAADPSARLFLMEGAEVQRGRGIPVGVRWRTTAQIVSQLREAGKTFTLINYPGLSHGTMFPTSAEGAMLDVAGVVPLTPSPAPLPTPGTAIVNQ